MGYNFFDIPGLEVFDTVMTTFLAVYMATLLVAYILGIVSYVLQSVGFYSMAKRRGIHNPWLAWVPVGNVWILGSISDQYQYVAKGNVRNRRKTLLGLMIAMLIISVLTVVALVAFFFGAVSNAGTLDSLSGGVGLLVAGFVGYLALLAVSLTLLVFQHIALYDLYASSRPGGAVAFLVLGIFFSFLIPFFVFACRKKDGGMPPRPAPQQIPEEPVYLQPEEVITEEGVTEVVAAEEVVTEEVITDEVTEDDFEPET